MAWQELKRTPLSHALSQPPLRPLPQTVVTVRLLVCFANQCLRSPQAALLTQDRSVRIPLQVVTTANAVLRLAVAPVVCKVADLHLENTVLVLQV